VLFVHDLLRRGEPAYEAADRAIAEQLRAHGVDDERILVVHNKLDQAAAGAGSDSGLAVSAQTGQGLEALRQALLERAGWQAMPEGVALARTRHLQALQRAAGHLAQAQAQTQLREPALDLLAEELRCAHSALGEITGQVSADDLLGVIFSSFCIGK
jgi:tRNA modification GTPase